MTYQIQSINKYFTEPESKFLFFLNIALWGIKRKLSLIVSTTNLILIDIQESEGSKYVQTLYYYKICRLQSTNCFRSPLFKLIIIVFYILYPRPLHQLLKILLLLTSSVLLLPYKKWFVIPLTELSTGQSHSESINPGLIYP